MKLSLLSPIKAFLSSYTEDKLQSLRNELTYTNTSVQHLIKRHHKSFFWKQCNQDSWTERLDGLKKQLKVCLVFEEEGRFYIRPGSIPYLSGFEIEVDNQIIYPTPKKMPWH